MFLIKDNDGVLEACNSFELLATAEEDHSNATKHFTGTSGSSDTAKHQQSPLDFFLGAAVFHLIAEETNRYTKFKGAKNFLIIPAEISAFVGINIANGIVHTLHTWLLEHKSGSVPTMVIHGQA